MSVVKVPNDALENDADEPIMVPSHTHCTVRIDVIMITVNRVECIILLFGLFNLDNGVFPIRIDAHSPRNQVCIKGEGSLEKPSRMGESTLVDNRNQITDFHQDAKEVVKHLVPSIAAVFKSFFGQV